MPNAFDYKYTAERRIFRRGAAVSREVEHTTLGRVCGVTVRMWNMARAEHRKNGSRMRTLLSPTRGMTKGAATRERESESVIHRSARARRRMCASVENFEDFWNSEEETRAAAMLPRRRQVVLGAGDDASGIFEVVFISGSPSGGCFLPDVNLAITQLFGAFGGRGAGQARLLILHGGRREVKKTNFE